MFGIVKEQLDKERQTKKPGEFLREFAYWSKDRATGGKVRRYLDELDNYTEPDLTGVAEMSAQLFGVLEHTLTTVPYYKGKVNLMLAKEDQFDETAARHKLLSILGEDARIDFRIVKDIPRLPSGKRTVMMNMSGQ